ncbi:MAG: hypothetical protein N4A38_01865 [Candidatus Gracilibacteria bacterium]|nr:hypothetical protein [Candidatus Gracilibacteria bacterium]
MNYKLLKALLDNILQNFECQNCTSKTNEENIEIIGIAGKNVTLNIKCKACGKNSIIKAEANEVKLNAADKEKLELIKAQLEKKLGRQATINIVEENGPSIEEKEIIELNEKLQQEETSIEDLLK